METELPECSCSLQSQTFWKIGIGLLTLTSLDQITNVLKQYSGGSTVVSSLLRVLIVTPAIFTWLRERELSLTETFTEA
jgi:hypothetical protein